MAGTLVTAGGIVFTGRLTGEFMAVDADTGKILWEFQTSGPASSDSRSPGSATASNTSPSPAARPDPTSMRVGDPNLANVPAGGSAVDVQAVRGVIPGRSGPAIGGLAAPGFRGRRIAG